MTVAELRKLLAAYPDDLEVVFPRDIPYEDDPEDHYTAYVSLGNASVGKVKLVYDEETEDWCEWFGVPMSGPGDLRSKTALSLG